MRKILFILLIFIAKAQLAICQIEKRIEFPTNFKDQSFKIINLHEGGFLVLSHEGKSEILIQHFSTDLENQWSKKIFTSKNTEYLDYIQDNSVAYLLLQDEKAGKFFSVKVSYAIGLLKANELTSFPNFSYTTFQVNDEKLVIAGNVKKDPVLLFYSEEKALPKIVMGGFKVGAIIQSLSYINTHDLLVSFLLNEKKRNTIALRVFSQEGKVISQEALEPENKLSFLNCKAFQTDDNKTLIIGNYGFANNLRDGISISQGLFISFDDGSVKYFTFSELKNFFNYLNEKQAERVEKQIKKKKEKGDEIRWTYRMLVNQIVPQGKGFVVVADMFTPIVRNNNYSPYGGFGNYGYSYMMPYASYFNPYRYQMYGLNSWAYNPWAWGNTSRNSYIEGFKYSHGVLIKFNKEGIIEWDNSVVYDNLQMQNLIPKLNVTTTDLAINAAYAQGKMVNSHIFSSQGIEVEKEKIAVSNQDFQVKDTFDENVEFWYDSYYLSFGYQRGTESNEGNKRVFYISKLKLADK